MPSRPKYQNFLAKLLANQQMDETFLVTRFTDKELALCGALGMKLSWDSSTFQITAYWPFKDGKPYGDALFNIPDAEPAVVAVTAAIASPVSLANDARTMVVVAAIYQASGGPLDFSLTNVAGTVVYTQMGVADSTDTPFDLPEFRWGWAVKAGWSGAAAGGLVKCQRYSKSIETVV